MNELERDHLVMLSVFNTLEELAAKGFVTINRQLVVTADGVAVLADAIANGFSPTEEEWKSALRYLQEDGYFSMTDLGVSIATQLENEHPHYRL